MGVCCTFLNTSKILLIYIKPLLFSCIRYARKLIFYLKNLSKNNNFTFIFFITGDINDRTLPFSVWI